MKGKVPEWPLWEVQIRAYKSLDLGGIAPRRIVSDPTYHSWFYGSTQGSMMRLVNLELPTCRWLQSGMSEGLRFAPPHFWQPRSMVY